MLSDEDMNRYLIFVCHVFLGITTVFFLKPMGLYHLLAAIKSKIRQINLT